MRRMQTTLAREDQRDSQRETPRDLPRQLSRLVDQISTIVVGKRPQIEDSVACLLAGGHLLIEDVPGVGKTTLAHTLAVCLGLDFRRVQFTADLMPSDLIGVSVFERTQDRFVFHPGPVFAQVLLADEINRAGPKTQSALLEAMEEHQVSIDNDTRALPLAQGEVLKVRASEALLDYLQALIAATRSGAWFSDGLSPRAGIAVLRVARARALMAGRDYVAPDDIQAILPQAIAHRLTPIAGCGRGPVEQVRAMVEATAVP